MFKQFQIFPSICHFQTCYEKKFLNISVLVSEIVTFMAKKKSLHEFPPKFFKTTERHSLAVCGSFCGEKQFLLISILYYRFVKKKLFKQMQIFLWICSFSNMVRKTNWLSISVLVFAIVTFMSKKKVLYEFPQKCFKTTERHSLAVCGSICGEKQFLLIFIRFYWFDQKQLFKQIQIFLRICLFSNMVKKKKNLCISVLVSEIVNFWSKNKSSLWISQKCIKTTEKHSLAVFGTLGGEKRFLLIFIPYYWFEQKELFKQIHIFLRICPFQHGEKNKLSEYCSARFWDSQFYV